MTYVMTSRLEADTKKMLISLTDDDFIEYMTEEPIAANTGNTNDGNDSQVEIEKGMPKKTPKKKGIFSFICLHSKGYKNQYR